MRVAFRILSVIALISGFVPVTLGQEGPKPVVANQASKTTPVATPVSNSQEPQQVALNNLLNSFELYNPTSNLQGSAKLSGSMTMVSLGSAWALRFRNFHKDVKFERGVDGTENGIQELAKDPSTIVGTSRPITQDEIAKLKAGACKEPLSVVVALDPLAVYVHESNPIRALSPEQIEGILRAPGQNGKHYSTWGELGVTGELADKPIRFHSRSEVSGTKAFIRQFILRGDEVVKEVDSYKSGAEICSAIANDPAGFGVCGFSDGNPGTRAVPLALRGTAVPANEESFLTGQYPLVRPLILLFDRAQMKTDGGLREAMLRYVLSRDGQMEAVRAGFFPLDPSYIHKQLDEICGTRMR